VTTTDRIRQRIPHREPFLFVDEIVSQDQDRIVCRKRFDGTEFWYDGHYPHDPITPGVILCEAAMQAGAVLLAERSDQTLHGLPVATRMSDVRFKRIVRPGETIQMEVRITDQLASAWYLAAKVTVNGKTAARFNFACTLIPTGDDENAQGLS